MEFTIKGTSQPETKVIIGKEALHQLKAMASGYTKTVLIMDEGTEKNCFGLVQSYLPDNFEKIVLVDGEDGKNLESAESILVRLRELGCDRKSLVIGLGGGVVNDIAGFAASIYMRGVDWIMLPTTLTAQADASIGGKTGVNLDKYKNMVGSFWPAKAVLISPEFLKTLPEDHLKNGLAEIIKMGIIYDKQILDYVAELDPSNTLDDNLIKASELAAKAKIEIVGADMREIGERKLLNFGHTVGHAVESLSLATDKPLLHGEAISVGMAAESKLAELEGVAETGLNDGVVGLLKKFGLPASFAANAEDVLDILASDKKNVGSRVNWTLPKTVGEGIFNHVADQANIEQAIKSVID